MKDKVIKVLIVVGIVVMILVYMSIADFSSPENKTEKLLKKIDNLELKIDSLNNKKDSIRTVIDSTHVKIITNEQHYKEVVNTIISQPTDSDYLFFKKYVNDYDKK